MKLDQETIEWVEQKVAEIEFGDVTLVFHVREGKVEGREKVWRKTEKMEPNPQKQ